MPKGIYLTIGLNSVDKNRYDGWDGNLNACEYDAKDLAGIAKAAGLTGSTLLTTEALSSAVLSAINNAAEQLVSGDFFFLGYSGHGGQVGDINAEEEDALDETWCLYDRMLIDDELYSMWSKFKTGVRIFVLSDSCHSGTVVKMKQYNVILKSLSGTAAAKSNSVNVAPFDVTKAIPFDKSWNIYIKNKEFYDSIQYVAGSSTKANIQASVILISGCQDNQLSLDGEKNGLFTSTLKSVWGKSQFKRNYSSFRDEIVKLMPPSQTPNYLFIGTTNMAYESQVPFSV